MAKFCADPTKTALITLAILVMFLFAISPDKDTSFTIMLGAFVLLVAIVEIKILYEIYAECRARQANNTDNVHLIGCDPLDFSPRGTVHELGHQVALQNRDLDEFGDISLRIKIQEFRRRVAYLHQEIDRFENLTREINSGNDFGNQSVSVELMNILPDKHRAEAASLSASSKEYTKINIPDHEDHSWEEFKCNMCLEEIDGEPFRILLCFHQFHTRCIDSLLEQNGLCPICKKHAGFRSALEN